MSSTAVVSSNANGSSAPPAPESTEKKKSTFEHLDINKLYKGKAAEPSTAKPTTKHGLQTIGKALPARGRVQKTPEPAISISTSLGQQIQRPSPLQIQPSNQNHHGISQHAPPPIQHQPPPPLNMNQGWPQQQQQNNYSRFAQEFPSLDAAAAAAEKPSPANKDNQYGPGPVLRPQTEGSWTQGGGSRGMMMIRPPPPPPPGGGMPNQPPRDFYGGMMPGQFRGPPPQGPPGNYMFPPGNQPPPPPLNHQFQAPRGFRPQMQQQPRRSHFSSQSIIKAEEMARMEEISSREDGGWSAAAADDVDYNKKISFEEEDQTRDIRESRDNVREPPRDLGTHPRDQNLKNLMGRDGREARENRDPRDVIQPRDVQTRDVRDQPRDNKPEITGRKVIIEYDDEDYGRGGPRKQDSWRRSFDEKKKVEKGGGQLPPRFQRGQFSSGYGKVVDTQPPEQEQPPPIRLLQRSRDGSESSNASVQPPSSIQQPAPRRKISESTTSSWADEMDDELEVAKENQKENNQPPKEIYQPPIRREENARPKRVYIQQRTVEDMKRDLDEARDQEKKESRDEPKEVKEPRDQEKKEVKDQAKVEVKDQPRQEVKEVRDQPKQETREPRDVHKEKESRDHHQKEAREPRDHQKEPHKEARDHPHKEPRDHQREAREPRDHEKSRDNRDHHKEPRDHEKSRDNIRDTRDHQQQHKEPRDNREPRDYKEPRDFSRRNYDRNYKPPPPQSSTDKGSWRSNDKPRGGKLHGYGPPSDRPAFGEKQQEKQDKENKLEEKPEEKKPDKRPEPKSEQHVTDKKPEEVKKHEDKKHEEVKKVEEKKEDKKSDDKKKIIPPPTSAPVPLMALGEISPPDMPMRRYRMDGRGGRGFKTNYQRGYQSRDYKEPRERDFEKPRDQHKEQSRDDKPRDQHQKEPRDQHEKPHEKPHKEVQEKPRDQHPRDHEKSHEKPRDHQKEHEKPRDQHDKPRDHKEPRDHQKEANKEKPPRDSDAPKPKPLMSQPIEEVATTRRVKTVPYESPRGGVAPRFNQDKKKMPEKAVDKAKPQNEKKETKPPANQNQAEQAKAQIPANQSTSSNISANQGPANQNSANQEPWEKYGSKTLIFENSKLKLDAVVEPLDLAKELPLTFGGGAQGGANDPPKLDFGSSFSEPSSIGKSRFGPISPQAVDLKIQAEKIQAVRSMWDDSSNLGVVNEDVFGEISHGYSSVVGKTSAVGQFGPPQSQPPQPPQHNSSSSPHSSSATPPSNYTPTPVGTQNQNQQVIGPFPTSFSRNFTSPPVYSAGGVYQAFPPSQGGGGGHLGLEIGNQQQQQGLQPQPVRLPQNPPQPQQQQNSFTPFGSAPGQVLSNYIYPMYESYQQQAAVAARISPGPRNQTPIGQYSQFGGHYPHLGGGVGVGGFKVGGVVGQQQTQAPGGGYVHSHQQQVQQQQQQQVMPPQQQQPQQYMSYEQSIGYMQRMQGPQQQQAAAQQYFMQQQQQGQQPQIYHQLGRMQQGQMQVQGMQVQQVQQMQKKGPTATGGPPGPTAPPQGKWNGKY